MSCPDRDERRARLDAQTSEPDRDEQRARLLRIERLIALGRRIADPADSLGVEARRRLLVTSGLTREGIELALTEHLETRPSREDIDALLASSSVGASAPSPAPRCHVVIAANVCTAALRALAVALAASPTVFVRPSSRDPVLAEILVRELGEDALFVGAGGSAQLVSDLQPQPGDELHVYGSDRTVEALGVAAGPGVAIRGHGTGIGLAVVGASLDERSAARAAARDIVPFDQRGCLSPRIALVEGSSARAAAVCDALHEALGASGIPRGPLDSNALADLAMYRASIEAIGRLWEGPDHLVGLDPEPRALILPPPARALHVVPIDAGSAAALLEPWARYVTAVGADDEGALIQAVVSMLPGARRSRLGAMQRPPLDGPVDLRSR